MAIHPLLNTGLISKDIPRSLFSFFRKNSGAKTHLESYLLQLKVLHSLFEPGKILDESKIFLAESKLYFHLLTALYLENRTDYENTYTILNSSLYSSIDNAYLQIPEKTYRLLLYITVYRLLIQTDSNYLCASSPGLWTQLQTAYFFIKTLVLANKTFETTNKSIIQFTQDLIENFKLYHIQFWKTERKFPSTFYEALTFLTLPLDIKFETATCIIFASNLQSLISDVGILPEKTILLLQNFLVDLGQSPVAICLNSLCRCAYTTWVTTGMPKSLNAFYISSNVTSKIPDTFNVLTQVENNTFITLLQTSKILDYVITAAIYNRAKINIDQTQITAATALLESAYVNYSLLSIYPPEVDYYNTYTNNSLIKALTQYLKQHIDKVYLEIETALTNLICPVDKQIIKNRLIDKYRSVEEQLQLLDKNFFLQELIKAAQIFYVENIKQFELIIAEAEKLFEFTASIFNFTINKGMWSLTESKYTGIEHIPVEDIQLKFNNSPTDINFLVQRIADKKVLENIPRTLNTVVQYMSTAIMQTIILRIAQLNNKKQFTIQLQDLSF